MPTRRLPVYIWNDYLGNVYALPVETDHFYPYEPYDSVVAPTLDQALRQVRDGLRQHLDAARQRGREIAWPDPVAYELKTVSVEVRPRYVKDDKPIPLDEKITFQLPILVGKVSKEPHSEPRSSRRRSGASPGLLRCCMPTIMRWFYCFESDDYKTLAGEAYRETLSDYDPEEILLDVPFSKGKIVSVSFPDKNRPAKKSVRHFEYLERVARPLISERKRGPGNAYCREEELQKLISLIQGTKRNIALLAPEGTGRSTLLGAAVRQLEKKVSSESVSVESGESDSTAGVPRFWSASATNLISGAKYLGQWQEQIHGVVNDLATCNGVLCLDNLAEAARLGGEPEESVAAFLTPYLEAGTLRMIGRITPGEWDILQHRCGDFIDKFSLFPLRALGVEETTTALRQLGETLCRRKRVRKTSAATRLDADVPALLIRLFRRFYPYQVMPGGPAQFLGRLVARSQRSGAERIDQARAVELFLEETGLPSALLKNSETLSFEEVHDYFSHDIIGQDAGCRAVAQAVVAYKAAMNDPRRPIRSLLFCGPTGVGKTRLAKTLADYLFGNSPILKTRVGTGKRQAAGTRFFRIDMSEYMHPWSATRLIELEDGMPGPLIRHVRAQPFSVILFDEIEKAAPEVFDLLLGLLDEGRLTDRFGRTTSFQSTIIIMTSNLGTGIPSVGFGGRDDTRDDSRFLKAVRDYFRPEFFNRIDDIIPFRALDRDSCRRIIVHELERLDKREGLAARKLRFVPEERLVDRLLRAGFDPKFGARPLQREIESFVLPLLARRLLDPDGNPDTDDYFRLEPP